EDGHHHQDAEGCGGRGAAALPDGAQAEPGDGADLSEPVAHGQTFLSASTIRTRLAWIPRTSPVRRPRSRAMPMPSRIPQAGMKKTGRNCLSIVPTSGIRTA